MIAPRLAARVAALILVTAAVARAQAPPPPASHFVGRSAPDQVTVRALRTPAPLTIDGRLDEEIYGAVEPLTDFIQQEPREGQTATEKTDAWIFFDDTYFYVSARCWDSHPEREVANELRRSCSVSRTKVWFSLPRMNATSRCLSPARYSAIL